MDQSEYSRLALRTEGVVVYNQFIHALGLRANTDSGEFETMDQVPPLLRVLHGVIGKADEIGELCGAVKRATFGGHALDEANVAEERGDDAWYDNLIDDALGFDPAAIRAANIAKLERRYPDLRFDAARSAERDRQGERDAVESAMSPVDFRNREGLTGEYRDGFTHFVDHEKGAQYVRSDVYDAPVHIVDDYGVRAILDVTREVPSEGERVSISYFIVEDGPRNGRSYNVSRRYAYECWVSDGLAVTNC